MGKKYIIRRRKNILWAKVLLKLIRKMETDVLKVLLRHGKDVARVSKEHVATVFVLRHVLVFAFLEVVKLRGIVTLYPARLMQVDGFPAAFGVVFIL